MTENALSTLILFFVQLQQTETLDRKLSVFQSGLKAQQKMMQSQISYEIFIVNRY